MKKLLALSIVLISLVSCSKDENENISSNSHPIIGTWYLFAENGVPVNSCEKQTTTTFLEDKSFSVQRFRFDNNNCIEEDIVSGTWENVINGIYELTVNGNVDTRAVTFTDNNNTLSYIDPQNNTTAISVVLKRK